MKKTQTKKAVKHFFADSLRKFLSIFLAVILVAASFIYLQVKNIYASTAPEYYSISYNANGGVGSPSDSNQYTSGSIVMLASAGSVTREGYNFSGWGTSPDGGAVYSAGGTLTITSNIVLYAIWTEKPASVKTYNLYYDANGGTGGPATERGFTYDQQVTVSYGKPTRAGDTFLYWTTQANGGGTKYGPGNTFTIHSETTLYAQWRSGANAQANTSRRSSTTTTTSSSAPATTSSLQSSSSESISSDISSEVIESETSSLQSETSLESISNNSSSSSSSADVVTVAVLPPAELLVKLKELGVATPFSIPLHNAGLPGTWSLFSLLAMIVTVIVSIVVMVKVSTANKKNIEESDTSLKTTVLSILAMLLGPLTALFFLLLEQFSSLMVLFNSYSIWFGLLLIVQIVFLILLAKAKKNPSKEDFSEDYNEYENHENEDIHEDDYIE